MNALQGKQVVIVGAGPGGLTLARLLQMQGVAVAVYERDTDRFARVQGSALDLHAEAGLAALEACGLMGDFWPLVRYDLDRLRFADDQGNLLYEMQRGQSSGINRPEIERGPLRDLLLNSLQPGTVHWNKRLESALIREGRVQLHFADDETVLADLAIGADGANSRLRPLVTPIRPVYAGVSLVEGLVPAAATAVPEIWAMLGGSALMALGTRQTLAMATKSDGSMLFYAGLRAPSEQTRIALAQAADASARVSWFRAHFSTWNELWNPLFASSPQLTWRPQFVCPFDQQWDVPSCVTLLGDAAHVMPPYAGEGVNMAMLDALVLSREVAGNADLQTAIGIFQREMLARTAKSAQFTMENTERFYSADAAQQIVAMFQRFAQMAASGATSISDFSN